MINGDDRGQLLAIKTPCTAGRTRGDVLALLAPLTSCSKSCPSPPPPPLLRRLQLKRGLQASPLASSPLTFSSHK